MYLLAAIRKILTKVFMPLPKGAKSTLSVRLKIERSKVKSPITDMNAKGLQKITNV